MMEIKREKKIGRHLTLRLYRTIASVGAQNKVGRGAENDLKVFTWWFYF